MSISLWLHSQDKRGEGGQPRTERENFTSLFKEILKQTSYHSSERKTERERKKQGFCPENYSGECDVRE